jgi:hypothetical protein
MGIGQGERGKESESRFAELADATVYPDPVVAVVMRLFAPPAMADNGIAQALGTAATDLPRTSCLACNDPAKVG